MSKGQVSLITGYPIVRLGELCKPGTDDGGGFKMDLLTIMFDHRDRTNGISGRYVKRVVSSLTGYQPRNQRSNG
jgi:hypothetical protein